MSIFEGQVGIVTGAARGIGRAIANRLAADGAIVSALDIKPLADPFCDPKISYVEMDVAHEAGWSDLVERIIAAHGQIDILVNNAGIGGSRLPIAEENMASWTRVLAVNLDGPFLAMRAVLPHMQARRPGSIINFSSIYGSVAVGGAAAYHASKAAIRHLSKHAAIAHAKDNVCINSIHPGIVETPTVTEDQDAAVTEMVIEATPLGRMGKIEEIVNGVVFLASNASSFVTGTELVVDGGYTAQ